MKKIIFLNFVLFISLLNLYSNDTTQCEVYIIRAFEYPVKYSNIKVYANSNFLVDIRNNNYYIFHCSQDSYKFTTQIKSELEFALNIENGETYYIKYNGIDEPSQFELLDSTEAVILLNKKSVKEVKADKLYVRPNSRFGFNSIIGGSNSKVTIIENTLGQVSSISYGGGIGFGLKYGYEVTKKFDIAIDANFQFNLMDTMINKIQVTFYRTNIMLTPSYIIPLFGGDEMRLKIGAGPDYYILPTMSIVGKDVSDKWHYENCFGAHVSSNFESNVFDEWMINVGFKWYTVKYKFKDAKVSKPTKSSLVNANGSGIDLMLGFFYNF